jgi:hypothetical protein
MEARMTRRKVKMGRPPKAPEDRYKAAMSLKMTKRDRAMLDRVVKAMGMVGPSACIRELIVREAGRLGVEE